MIEMKGDGQSESGSTGRPGCADALEKHAAVFDARVKQTKPMPDFDLTEEEMEELAMLRK